MQAIDWSTTYNADLHPHGFITINAAAAMAKGAGYSAFVLEGAFYRVDDHGEIVREPGSLKPGVDFIDLPRPVIDHKARALTLSATFQWAAGWALDKCEGGVIVGEARRALVAYFKDYEQLAGLNDVMCWEPDEEAALGWRGYPPHPAAARVFDRPEGRRA